MPGPQKTQTPKSESPGGRTEPSLSSPAPEILDYLARHPDAQDTIDGILNWWVLDACIRQWAPKIAQTLELLVACGILEKQSRADGHTVYRLTPEGRAAL